MTPLLEKLYKEIEHGDEEHRKWLWDKLEDFSKRNFVELPKEKPYLGEEFKFNDGGVGF